MKENTTNGNMNLLRQSVNLTGLSSGNVKDFNMNGGVFDSSILKNNMLSGTSSQKSGDERSYKTSSPEDQRRGERD